jgi:fructose-bisphosphate aldolase class II
VPLATSKEILERALAERFAVGAFNANNMEMVQAIVETAQEERAPVILQVSQGAIRYAGLAYAAGMVKIAASLADAPVVLHLDTVLTLTKTSAVCVRDSPRSCSTAPSCLTKKM